MLKSLIPLILLSVPLLAQQTRYPQTHISGQQTPPNIVFILADDLGYGDLGCYGQEKIKTPNIDHLAGEGLKLTQHYSGAPVCAPARCVLLTGKHLAHAQIRGNKELGRTLDRPGQWPLTANALTIAEVLSKAGYQAGAFGKWGLGPPDSSGSPIKQGFDRFYGYNCQRVAHSYYPAYLVSDEKNVTINENPVPGHQRQTKGEVRAENYRAENYAPDLILAEALKFIDQHKDKPFFLFLPFVEPHVAIHPPQEWIDRYPVEWDKKPYRGQAGYLPHPRPRAGYAAMISDLDEHVGAVLARLKKHGLDKNTIVIFTSDNGPTYNGGSDHRFFNSASGLRGLKGSLYEGGLKVPCIIRWPGKIEPGTVNGYASYFADWFPTLANIGKASLPDTTHDGIDLIGVLNGTPLPEREKPMIWEFNGYGGIVAIRDGKWKALRRNLLLKKPSPWELYDIGEDPAEKKDLAKKYPHVVRRLEAHWLKTRLAEPDFPMPLIDSRTAAIQTPAPAKGLSRHTLSILPRPQQATQHPGHFIYSAETGVDFQGDAALSLLPHLKSVFKREKWHQTKQGPRLVIECSEIPGREPSAYRLSITPDGIRLTAGDEAGLFYALQSLRQLLPVEMEKSAPVGSVRIPCMEIIDKPRFAYRGMLLDSGRQFHTVSFVKRFIDQLAMMKMNVLHWHLTEADGWRIEIKQYPKLTEIGSQVAIRHRQQHGYYTQEQIKDIVRYAQERHVTIIPEFDIPGHSAAALEAYPFLSCTGKAPDRRELEKKGEGWKHHEIMCGSKPKVLQFYKDVLAEVVGIFPSPYIHIGGDEAQKSKWNKCPHCQQAIKDKKLKNAHELQVNLTIELADFLKTKGRKTICWGDVVTRPGPPIPKHIAVQWWNYRAHKFKTPHKAFEFGLDLFCSPNYYTYLNFQVYPWKGYKRDRTFDLETAYINNTIDKVNVPAGKGHLMKALIGAVWCDFGLQQEDIDKLLFPRVYALAELAWHTGPKEEFPSFYEKVKAQYPRLKVLGVDYGPAVTE